MDNIINKDMIILGLEASSKEEVIKKLAGLIERQDRLTDISDYIQHVFEREETFPTAVGFDVAIPHGKCDSVKQAALAFARLKDEIQWSEDERVRYIFLIAVPGSEAGDTHLKILAQLSRKIMREEFRAKLMEADSVDEIYQVLTEN